MGLTKSELPIISYFNAGTKGLKKDISMGIYYSSISKRTHKTSDGITFSFSNFYGKDPSMFSKSKSWNSFATRALNTSAEMKERGIRFVVNAKNITEMNEHGQVSIAKWDGQALLHDGFWDNNIIGHLEKRGRSWVIVLNERGQNMVLETMWSCE